MVPEVPSELANPAADPKFVALRKPFADTKTGPLNVLEVPEIVTPPVPLSFETPPVPLMTPVRKARDPACAFCRLSVPVLMTMLLEIVHCGRPVPPGVVPEETEILGLAPENDSGLPEIVSIGVLLPALPVTWR